MKNYKIVRRILKYKERNNLSYRALGDLLGCDGGSLHYLLNKGNETNLAFQVVDKFETLAKKAKAPVVPDEDDGWE